MTVHYLYGNVLDSTAEVLVCTTNTVGAMGKGIAKEFKEKVPGLYKAYRQHCFTQGNGLRQHFVYPWGDRTVYCFHTKLHWGNDSKPEYVQKGLYTLYYWMKKNHPASIAIPPLGCGNGNLDYARQVHPMLIKFAEQFPHVEIQLYCPDDFRI